MGRRIVSLSETKAGGDGSAEEHVCYSSAPKGANADYWELFFSPIGSDTPNLICTGVLEDDNVHVHGDVNASLSALLFSVKH